MPKPRLCSGTSRRSLDALKAGVEFRAPSGVVAVDNAAFPNQRWSCLVIRSASQPNEDRLIPTNGTTSQQVSRFIEAFRSET